MAYCGAMGTILALGLKSPTPLSFFSPYQRLGGWNGVTISGREAAGSSPRSSRYSPLSEHRLEFGYSPLSEHRLEFGYSPLSEHRLELGYSPLPEHRLELGYSPLPVSGWRVSCQPSTILSSREDGEQISKTGTRFPTGLRF